MSHTPTISTFFVSDRQYMWLLVIWFRMGAGAGAGLPMVIPDSPTMPTLYVLSAIERSFGRYAGTSISREPCWCDWRKPVMICTVLRASRAGEMLDPPFSIMSISSRYPAGMPMVW